MGGRSGLKNQRNIKSESQHGEWIKTIDENTGAIRWIRKKIKRKK